MKKTILSFEDLIEYKKIHNKKNFCIDTEDLQIKELHENFNNIEKFFEKLLNIPFNKNSDWIIHFTPFSKIDKNNKYDRTLFVLDLDLVWGKLFNAFKYAIVEDLDFYSESAFKKLIDISNRKIALGPHELKLKISFRSHLVKFGRWRQQGFRKYIPFPFYVGKVLDGNNRYGFQYGIEMGSRRVMDDVNKVKQLLSNTRSREIYSIVMEKTADKSWKHFYDNLYAPSQYNHYLRWSPETVVVNGGIFTGAEIPMFSSFEPKKMYHIDPMGDSKLHEYTRRFVEDKNSKTEHIFVKEMLAKVDGEVIYYNKDEQVSIIENGPHTTKGISLKGIYSKYNIGKATIHKYDLEGAEELIIDNLLEIMQEERSQLALSIYHRPNEYTSYPLLFMENLKDYSFYIEHYSYEKYETILFCIPKEIEND